MSQASLEGVAVPEVGSGDVLIKMRSVIICGMDLYISRHVSPKISSTRF